MSGLIRWFAEKHVIPLLRGLRLQFIIGHAEDRN